MVHFSTASLNSYHINLPEVVVPAHLLQYVAELALQVGAAGVGCLAGQDVLQILLFSWLEKLSYGVQKVGYWLLGSIRYSRTVTNNSKTLFIKNKAI